MIDYSAAGNWSVHVHALAKIESAEDVGRIGDGGRAISLLQQHPSFFYDWYGYFDDKYVMSVTDTWWEAQIKAAAAFLEVNVPLLTLDLAIQAYNLGIRAVQFQGKRNPAYLAKWTTAFQKLRAQQ